MNTVVNTLVNDSQPILGLVKSAFQFNDIDLVSLVSNSTGYAIKNGNELSLDNIILEQYVSEIIDGGTIIDKRYGNKTVPFKLFIQGADYADLITKIQALKSGLNDKNGFLYITRAGVSYRYTVTSSNIVIPNFNTNEDFVDNVEISFIFTSPHGVIEEAEVVQLSETSDFQKIISNTGNYKSYPRMIFVGKAGNTTTDIDIELKKVGDITGENLTIDQALNEGDVLEVDYNEKTVIYNGTEIAWDGFMTPLQVGMNVFDFTFTGTVNMDIYILYNKVFL